MSADQGLVADRGARVEYTNPPIVEGLCQFNFAVPLSWSPILPGMFFERIKASYPAEPEVQQQVQANVQFQNDAAGQAQFTVGQGDQRLIYRNREQTRLAIVSPSTISVNSVPPYEGWPSLHERFGSLLDRTKSVLGNPQVRAVSVRYINRIFVPTRDPRAFPDYFTIPFHIVGDANSSPSAVFQRVETIQPDGVSRGVMTFVSVETEATESDGQAFLLDLEFQRELPTPAGFDVALSVANELKAMENAEFESCITDRTRGLFA